MLGRSHPVEGMPTRVREPTCSIEEFLGRREELCAKVLKYAQRREDHRLAAKAWEKSLEEEKRGVIVGPFETLESVPTQDPGLVWRKAVWEMRGEAEGGVGNAR